MSVTAIHRFQNYLEIENNCQLTFQLMDAAIFSRRVQNTQNSSTGCLHCLSYVGQTDRLNGPNGTDRLVNSLNSLPMERSSYAARFF